MKRCGENRLWGKFYEIYSVLNKAAGRRYAEKFEKADNKTKIRENTEPSSIRESQVMQAYPVDGRWTDIQKEIKTEADVDRNEADRRTYREIKNRSHKADERIKREVRNSLLEMRNEADGRMQAEL